MLDTDLAWAAGFIDGEGCFSVVFGNHGGHYVMLSVNNTSVEGLDRLQSIFGGCISNQTYRNVNYKPTSLWRVQGVSAAKVTELVLPFLTVKKQQAELLLEFQSTIGGRNKYPRGLPQDVFQYREDMKQRMHVLNKRGA